eukprot:TRINITY_DN15585_c0_g1_i1.p1 TRINITY_DN15585_c0_g1~~TRINITY_DN15585_c0_g1_i1.p1  ORF type:complete len:121 (+),score=14.18 TRINITY_DN15585_c0_g1_i1:258-620(+)
MDPESAVYIPSYFRKRVNILETTETSYITVESLQARIRDLGPGSFPSEVIELVSRLTSLCMRVNEQAKDIRLAFKPGELCRALQKQIDAKLSQLETSRVIAEEEVPPSPSAIAFNSSAPL